MQMSIMPLKTGFIKEVKFMAYAFKTLDWNV